MADRSVSAGAWNPTQYEKFKDERSRPFFDLLNMIEARSIANAIDLGCGTGELTATLQAKLKPRHTVGLDSSFEMLDRAKTFANAELSFETGDINAWSAKNKFDLIFSNAALQWCANHAELFKRLKSALVPGGQIAVQMPMNQDYATHLVAKEMAAELNRGIHIQESMLSIESYAKLIYGLGFKRQQVLTRVYGHELESREGVVEWVKGTTLTPFKNVLPADEYAEFLENYRARLFKTLPDDRPFFYPFKRVFIWASL